MNQAVIVSEVNLKGYNLSVTCRDNGEDSTILEELAYRTIGAWLWIASRLEQNVYTIPDELKGSVESRYAEDITRSQLARTDEPPKEPFEFKETFGDARVTIWDFYRGSKRVNFHLNSDDDLQRTVDTWCASQNAIDRAFEKWGDKVAESHQDAPTTAPANEKPAQPKNVPSAPVAPSQAVEGAIVATRAPNPKEKSYPDGQLVEYKINKIVLGTHPTSGSVIYSLWGELGKKYALQTVYVMASNGTEKSYNYKAVEAVLEPLGLSIPGKVQAEGNWKLICKASNAGEKQFMNIVSLTAF